MSSLGSSQVLHYEVVKGDRELGNMTVIREANDSLEYYHIDSRVAFRILFKFSVNYFQEESFVNGILQNGSGYNTLNGNKQNESQIEKLEQGYHLKLGSVISKLDEEALKYTISKIYFEEPYDGKKVFSQSFGRYLEFEKVDLGVYKLPSPDGDNYYTYTNGICTEVKVSRDFATFYFKMKPETLSRVKNDISSFRK
jgi:hypothetical protein